MRKTIGVAAALGALATLLMAVATASAAQAPSHAQRLHGDPQFSGDRDFGGREFGHYITECPQAKLPPNVPRGLDRREIDRVERISNRGDDRRTNYDQACVPENETSVAINPRHQRNLIAGANDYQGEYNSFYATPDHGKRWYGSLNLNPSAPTFRPTPGHPQLFYNLTQSDPVLIYDREGIAYNQEIAFALDDTNGVFVWRSTNGGFTWSRPCAPADPTPATPPSDEDARCGSTGDPRQPGDGVITYNQDPTTDPNLFDFAVPFDDKNWMAAGPRPAGVQPTCFAPVSRTPRPCNEDVIGVDRLHATWTRFDTDGTGFIYHSYSDDQARSWSRAKPVLGSASFCIGFVDPATDQCDDNQFSVPTVHPKTGLLGIAFENFNTANENQYLFVRSRDGGNTFEGPFFVTPVFDSNYPTGASTRPDCVVRGQSGGRAVLTNSCFRVNSGGAVVVDKRSGAFADDFYLVMSDNRNGTRANSNADTFFFRSTDGGSTWVGPTRVNNDRSDTPALRDCGIDPDGPGPLPRRPACPAESTGNDQWFPWIDIDHKGTLAVAFYDRREDEDSVAHAWPTSRQRPGNYLTWRYGAGCRVNNTPSRECLAPGAAAIPQPTAPQNPPDGAVPGQGSSFLGPFANSVISDVPSNMDYSFRAGIFMGDYDQVSYPNVTGHDKGDGRHSDGQAVAIWTDARNGRGSGAPTSFQAGRNPSCEQSDPFLDYFNPLSRDQSDSVSESEEELFLVTPCPGDSGRVHDGDGHGDGGDDDDD